MTTGLENWAINAYADGELDPVERANVERLLAGDPDARRILDGIERQKRALKSAYDSVLDEPVPRSLSASVQGSYSRRLAPYAAMAASLAILALGAAGGWYMAHESASTLVADMGRKAINAHEVYAAEIRHPVEVAASESDHIRKWLSKRIGTDITIPDLTANGYTFIGGRLLATDDRPAGQLMYEDVSKNRLTIFLAANPNTGGETIHVREKGELISCYWAENALAFAVTGEMPKDAMMKLANNIYDQMEQI